MSSKSKEWLKCALIRAIKTMCQTAIGIMGSSVVLTDVEWQTVLSASILAGVMSLLTSAAGLPEVGDSITSDDIDLVIEDDAEDLKEVSE